MSNTTNREIFRGKHVLELGAGCGLAGFLSAQFAEEVVVTDGNEVVLKLLNLNKSHFDDAVGDRGDGERARVVVARLLWGLPDEVQKIYGPHEEDLTESIVPFLNPNHNPRSSDAVNNSAAEGVRGPDIIIGADVILWPNFVAPLLYTIRMLLTRRRSVCFISYIVRATSTTNILIETADQLGLIVTDVDVDGFLLDTEGVPSCLKNLEKRLMKIELAGVTVADSGDGTGIYFSSEAMQETYSSAAAPC